VPPLLPALRGELGLTLVESGVIAIMLNVMGALVGPIAMLLAPFALAFVGWRGYWLLTGAACIVALALVARLVPAPAFGGNVRMGRLAAEALAHKGGLLLSLAFLGYTAEWATLMIWLPTYAVDQRGATPALAALLTVAMVAINVPGNLVGGWLMGRGASRGRLIVVASLVQATSFLVIFIEAFPDLLRYAACLLFSLVGGLVPMAVLSGVPVHARTREHIGTTNGLVMQSAQVGQVVGPLLVAAIAARLGWQASLPAMLAFAACSAAAGVAVGRLERASRPAP
jgi:sugar phosphate permease